MLKHLFLNQKKVPVPVPVKTLQEAVMWVESHLIAKDRTITKIEVDGKFIEGLEGRTIALGPDSKLSIQVDSPMDLAVQTIDAVRHLTNLVLKDLKKHAVLAWQMPPAKTPPFLKALQEDVAMLLELLEHNSLILCDLVGASETKNCENCASDLSRAAMGVDMAASQSDWKGLARLLLTGMEPKLMELHLELGHLQKMVFEIQADRRFKARSDIKNARAP